MSMRWTTRGGLHYMLPPAAATWTYAGQCYVYTYVCTYILACEIMLLSNLLMKYLEGHTKSVLLIRGTYHQYWLT